MSHFAVAVLTRAENREAAIEEAIRLLAPFDENGEWFAEGSRWDWYCVGGRFTGSWAEGFDPDKDPGNYEPCAYCAGTGTRRDMVTPHLNAHPIYPVKPDAKGCNACGGTGMSRKFNRHYTEVDSDVMPTACVPRTTETFALITPDGAWHERARMGWFGCERKDEFGDDGHTREDWKARWAELMDAHAGTLAVLVDCHV